MGITIVTRYEYTPLTMTRTYGHSSKIFDLCPNNVDTAVITCIQLQYPRLVELRPAKHSGFIT